MQLFKTFNKFFQTQRYSNNTIIMLLGNEHTMFTAYSLKGFTRTITVANNDPEFVGKYRSFLNQFKGWSIVILLDNDKIEIKSEALHILQSMFKIRDHAKHFVFSSVADDDVVAYCKTGRAPSSTENIENIVFAHTKLSAQVVDIISFIYHFNFPLLGIYILTIEIHEIIKGITNNINLTFENKFTIFAVPTFVSGIRIFALSEGIIVASKIIPYTHNQSVEYIAGLIEQSISDLLLVYKKYINSHKLVPEVISITSSDCAKIIDNHKLNVAWHSLFWSGVKQKMWFVDFGDEVLIHNLQLKYPATNRPLRNANMMEKINKYVLNSFFGVAACIFVYAGVIEYKILSTENKLDKLNTEYYKVSEAYREARKKLQNISGLPEIYDIMSDLAILRSPIQQPFEIVQHIMKVKEEKSNITEILWKLTSENIGETESELAIYTQYPGVAVSDQEVQKRVDKYQQDLSKLLQGYNISIIEAKKQQGVNLPNNLMIRTNFLIKGPVEK